MLCLPILILNQKHVLNEIQANRKIREIYSGFVDSLNKDWVFDLTNKVSMKKEVIIDERLYFCQKNT